MSASAPHSPTLRDRFAGDAPCVAVAFSDDASDIDVATAIANGMDVAEIRIDRFATTTVDHVIDQVRQYSNVPTIATIRSRTEGGDWPGDEASRRDLFEAVLPLVDAVDVELSATSIAAGVVAEAHARDKLVIVSFHDFDRTPSTAQLDDVVVRAKAIGADVVKVSVMVEATGDLYRLAEFTLAHRLHNVIVIGMGPLGSPSRILFPFLGSKLTFATDNRWSAPGQLTLEETVRTLSASSPAYAARLARF